MIDLILQRFNAAFAFSFKFKAMCVETSSTVEIVRFFLEIQTLQKQLTLDLLLMVDELLLKLLHSLQQY